jgi:hypothetical protein
LRRIVHLLVSGGGSVAPISFFQRASEDEGKNDLAVQRNPFSKIGHSDGQTKDLLENGSVA